MLTYQVQEERWFVTSVVVPLGQAFERWRILNALRMAAWIKSGETEPLDRRVLAFRVYCKLSTAEQSAHRAFMLAQSQA